MRRPGLFALFLSLVALAGCPVNVIVNPGGTVYSESGRYTCLAGAGCTIDVDTTDFNETFYAEADSGFIFLGWKRRERGFCGGRRTACSLFFPEELVEKFWPLVNSDEEFFLEAQFAESLPGDGPILEEDAVACFNSELWRQGTRYEQMYEVSTTTPGDGEDFAEDRFVDGPTEFNGTKAVQTTVSFETIPADLASTERYFDKVNIPMKRVSTIGIEGSDSLGGEGVQVFEPGRLFRYDLKPGQSYRQLLTATSTESFGGQTFDSVSELDRTVIYVGMQEITVPAGTYNACRFEIFNTIRASGIAIDSRQTLWLAEGDGVILREVDEESISSLVEGELNGREL